MNISISVQKYSYSFLKLSWPLKYQLEHYSRLLDRMFCLIILGGRCQTNDLLHDPNSYLLGNKMQNGIAHTFSSNGALHFMKSYGQVKKKISKCIFFQI